MKRIRGGSGLGDAIYVRPIVEHFIRAGEAVTVCSNYPDVFQDTGAKVLPFDRYNIDVLAHYTVGKRNPSTTQWDDICASARVTVPLNFDWTVKNRKLLDELRALAAGRPLILVSGGRVPMARHDGFGLELLPDRRAFYAVLEALHGCFTVQIGNAEQIYPLTTDANLSGKTSVADLFDLASSCDGLVGQCSFIIPLAEVFDKPLLVVWSASGLSTARHVYISSITPGKILSKPSSRFVIDEWPAEKLQEDARAFGDICRGGGAVQEQERGDSRECTFGT